MGEKSIYIILMNTGTLLSKTIRFITKYKYSHVVLSLDDSFSKLYSFGRKKVHNFLMLALLHMVLIVTFLKLLIIPNVLFMNLKFLSKGMKL